MGCLLQQDINREHELSLVETKEIADNKKYLHAWYFLKIYPYKYCIVNLNFSFLLLKTSIIEILFDKSRNTLYQSRIIMIFKHKQILKIPDIFKILILFYINVLKLF